MAVECSSRERDATASVAIVRRDCFERTLLPSCVDALGIWDADLQSAAKNTLLLTRRVRDQLAVGTTL